MLSSKSSIKSVCHRPFLSQWAFEDCLCLANGIVYSSCKAEKLLVFVAQATYNWGDNELNLKHIPALLFIVLPIIVFLFMMQTASVHESASFVLVIVIWPMLACLMVYLVSRYNAKITTPVTWNLFSRPIDTSIAHRVIRDMATKEEAVIDGDHATSFRKAMKDEEIWVFSQISRDSKWIITDDRGNDISNQPLSLFDGIARIEVLDA